MPDITITTDGGSMVGLIGSTEAGTEWITENLNAEPWQFLGPVLWIDGRFAADILEGAAADGLEVAR